MLDLAPNRCMRNGMSARIGCAEVNHILWPLQEKCTFSPQNEILSQDTMVERKYS